MNFDGKLNLYYQNSGFEKWVKTIQKNSRNWKHQGKKSHWKIRGYLPHSSIFNEMNFSDVHPSSSQEILWCGSVGDLQNSYRNRLKKHVKFQKTSKNQFRKTLIFSITVQVQSTYHFTCTISLTNPHKNCILTFKFRVIGRVRIIWNKYYPVLV